MERKDFPLNAQTLALLAHKLRTPLSVINGYCETALAQDKKALPLTTAKALQEINTQGLLLAQQVDKLLAFNQVFAMQEQDLQKQETPLKDLVKQVAAEALAQAEKFPKPAEPENPGLRSGTFIETDCPPALVVTADEKLLRLCILELLSNAIKFNPRAEKIIKIQCVNHGDRISVSVRDYGQGIRPQDIKRIFEPFYQVDDDFTGQVAGCGLGLSTVKQIAALHHGSVSVVSDRGLGSIFTLDLPIA